MQHLTDDSFENAVRTTKGPLLVMFSAAWCPPCKPTHTALEALAPTRPDVAFAHVDADESPAATTALGVRALPTLVLFLEGRPAAQTVGGRGRADLERWLEERAPRVPSLAT